MPTLLLLFICLVIRSIGGTPVVNRAAAAAADSVPNPPPLRTIDPRKFPPLPDGNTLPLPSLESSGCNISSVPIVSDVTASSIVGYWYQLYHSDIDFLEDFYKDIMTITNVRFTVVADSRFSDVLHFFRCTRNSYLGGLYAHNLCPASSFKMTVSKGIMTSNILDALKPISFLSPLLDRIQVRLTAMDEEFIAIYSCLLPLVDGTCAKSGLLLDIHSKNKQLSGAATERLKAVADSTCINFEKLRRITQDADYPFYVPAPQDLQ